MGVLFTLTVFLSAALLFLVQPMAAKMILPSFGGSPSVWNTCMVFFQATLLAGYAYAHFSTKRLGAARQSWLHVPLMLVPLLALPMALPKGYNPANSPLPTSLALLILLLSLVGLPFLMVSTGAPILQRWFGATRHAQAHDPYFLYAASNLGSLIGLLSYPFLIEPHLRLADQARFWGYGYGALVVLVGACALATTHCRAPSEGQEHAREPADGKHVKKNAAVEIDSPQALWKRRGMWILLAAVPSSLLLGVTNYLTTNISPVPLLWVVPLSLYLLTYVAAFARWRPIATSTYGRIAALGLAPVAIVLVLESTQPIVWLSVLHLLVFSFAALYCHSRLADDRPPVARLTEFYLCLSVGGVLGGAFNALFAPTVFATLAEYPLAYVVLLFLQPHKEGQERWRPWDFAYPALVALATFFAAKWADGINEGIGKLLSVENMPDTDVAVKMGIPCILAFFAVDRPRRYSLAIGAFVFVSGWLHTSLKGDLVWAGRSFFGVYRIVDERWASQGEEVGWYKLLHGNTLHGRQFHGEEHRRRPLTYYSREGPVGDVILKLEKAGKLNDIGLVGLGVGTLSAYGRTGQRLTFFEIDPLIERVATGKYFTYLADAKVAGAQVEIVLGDARLSLQNQPDASFDLLVLDAFSSDAIPIHLLTLEAFRTYLNKLRPGGMLAIHISNRYLNLALPLGLAAKSLELFGLEWMQSKEEASYGAEPSRWVVLARSKQDLEQIYTASSGWNELDTSVPGHAWTDDFSDLLSAWDPQ